MKLLFNSILARFNIKVTKNRLFRKLLNIEIQFKQYYTYSKDLQNLLKAIILNSEGLANDDIENSKSQFLQDIIVLDLLDFKKEGYFIELGACDGVVNSNTYLLEKNFSWDGILIEPVKSYFKELCKNRNSECLNLAILDEKKEKVLFTETDNKDLSTLSKYKFNDIHNENRENSTEYFVMTDTLQSVIKENSSQKIIDYLSLDTEGSEYDILKKFDFQNYKIKVITVEHNFSQNRELLEKLLVSNNFIRYLPELSQVDDIYINKEFTYQPKYFS
jgi:FkbM family methyltransferase